MQIVYRVHSTRVCGAHERRAESQPIPSVRHRHEDWDYATDHPETVSGCEKVVVASYFAQPIDLSLGLGGTSRFYAWRPPGGERDATPAEVAAQPQTVTPRLDWYLTND